MLSDDAASDQNLLASKIILTLREIEYPLIKKEYNGYKIEQKKLHFSQTIFSQTFSTTKTSFFTNNDQQYKMNYWWKNIWNDIKK